MDSEIICTLKDSNSLLESILETKKNLTNLCFSKYGGAKIHSLEVFSVKKYCELLTENLQSKNTEDLKKSNYYCNPVAQFENFHLYEYLFVDDSTLKVEAKFDIDNDCSLKSWYGIIHIVEPKSKNKNAEQ